MVKPLNATFFAFRKRERAVLLPATIVYAVLSIIIGGAFVGLNWGAFVEYVNWVSSLSAMAGQASDETAVMQAMTPPSSVAALGGVYLLFLLVYYILMAAYEAACLRWMIRGETEGLFGLSLGADTWRVYFTYWIWFFLVIAFYLVCALLVGGVVIGMMGALQGGAPESGAMMFAPLGVGLLVLVLLIYFAVRLAPAAATSIARRRFAFFDAWTVTKGRFWALLGAFALLFLMFFVLIIVLETILGVAMAMTAMNQVGHADPKTAEEAFRAFANPQWAAMIGGFVIVMMVAAFVFYIALFGVNARAAQAALEEGKIQSA